MRCFALPALVAGLLFGLAPSAPAQTVESRLTVQLTARIEQAALNGVRIVSLRAGTRDLIEALMESMALTGRITSLVMRRDIADLDLLNAQTILIVDGVEYPLPSDFISDPQLVMPQVFDASVTGFTLRLSDGETLTQAVEGISVLLIGDPNVDGFQIGVLTYDTSSARLRTVLGVDLGMLYSRISMSVVGGLLINDPNLPDPFPLQGKLMLGPERIISP